MRKNTFIIIGYVVLVVLLVLSYRNNGKYAGMWEKAEANVKAYDNLLSGNAGNAAFELNIDQFSSARDSVLRELDDTRKKLKVKDRNLKSAQKVSSDFSRTDTVVLQDTFLMENSAKIDTFLKDDWYQLHIKLEYPDTMIVSPSFKSEKNIIVSTRKETVNPPKKFWLFRLFQKKYKVLQVDVIEKNPYITNQNSRYVEIIK